MVRKIHERAVDGSVSGKCIVRVCDRLASGLVANETRAGLAGPFVHFDSAPAVDYLFIYASPYENEQFVHRAHSRVYFAQHMSRGLRD